MIKNITLLFISIFFLTDSLAQQHPYCGTSNHALQTIQNRLIANKQWAKSNRLTASARNQEDVFVPLKFHLVGENNGSGRIEIAKVLDQMCTLNETFKSLGIQFYVKEGVNMINNGIIYDSQKALAIVSEMEAERDPEAVNIFLVNRAVPPDRPGIPVPRPGTLLGYFTPPEDWVVVVNGSIGEDNMTLQHELGHFFSLPHPFSGWDSEPYDPEVHGSPAPEVSSGGVVTEYADGSNCETAGDMICDTPADYLYFSQLSDDECAYNKVIIDPKGDTLQPDASLIMGYFGDACINRFTPQQVEFMLADLEQGNRAYLKNSYTPSIAPMPDPTVAEGTLSPADDATVASLGEVTLEWAPVEGASGYYINSSIDGFEEVIVNESSLTVSVEIGSTNLWRVRPFNDANFCTDFSPPFGFWKFTVEMASSVPTIGGVDDWSVHPNPVANTTDLQIAITANEVFTASLQLRNVAGSIVRHIPSQSFFTGDNKVVLSSKGLEAGLYILSLENEEGVTQRKVVVF